MSDASLAARLRRLEAQVAFAVDTWGLCRAHEDGLRTMQREVLACAEEAALLARLLAESPPTEAELDGELGLVRHPHARREGES